MRLKKVSWKNFKSYSNIMTELDFSDIHSLNLIIGVNGTGKSSIAECITYLMYGKIENFTASEIPNRTNKNFYGKIELDCGGHNVIIERGLAPTIFTVTIDGNVVDTAGKTNVQDMLEEVYYRIPYSVFKNIIVLSINDFKSLVNLNLSDKRNIIDRIFGFTIFNEVLKKVKEDVKGIDSEISENSGSLRANNNSIERIISQVNELKNNMVSQDEIKKLALKIQETAEKEKKNEESLVNRLKIDPMTGILNKTSMQNVISEYLTLSRPTDLHALFMIDTDNFKAVNDNLGHMMGDEVIQIVARTVKETFRDSDYVGRVGGDEFMAFMKNTTPEATLNRARALNESMRRTFEKDGVSVSVSCSIGIAFYAKDGEDFETLYRNADARLYLAKRNGKNRFEYQ